MCDPRPLKIALHRMAPVKADKIVLPAHEIQTRRRRLLHTDRTVTEIDDLRAPGDDVLILKHAVQQAHLHPAHGILQEDFQALRLSLRRMHRRKPLQPIFSAPDLVSDIAQVTVLGTICIAYHKGAAAVIPRPRLRILLRQGIQGVCPVISGIRRISREPPVIVRQEIRHISRYLSPIIQM